MGTYKENAQKYFLEYKGSVYCPHCGHSMSFPYNTPSRICTWCRNMVYNKTEQGKKQKFKDELIKTVIRLKREERQHEFENKQIENTELSKHR